MDYDPNFKSGFVAVIGRPNVGKSTLLNVFLAQKIAAVSPRPQTTRRRQLGILTLPQAQIIFVDTPGIHHPVHRLGEYMNQVALDALHDADVILWLVDGSARPNAEDQLAADYLKEAGKDEPLKVVLALNKIDLVPEELRSVRLQEYLSLYPQAFALMISASTGLATDALLEAILERLPPGPRYYDEEQVTDLQEREIAADLIREAVLRHLKDEVPHAVAVRIDEFKDRNEETSYIAATLLVERESQKPILIGKGGEMLKRIGTTARKEIEAMTGRTIFLDLHVKVMENWRQNPAMLRQLGYVLTK
ncbi:MAG TPA: GTPase Era [Anaerolinea thermolimosa]|uniref:GTPase Era n=1 Tax=Anaerolinea thermolimosa TaxID=229919 RepID=A0A0M8JP32_9CHLR|nr:GTPase Era [Anaerolinea thermolimosa]GAP08713.1 GTP-binding protein Era [Anaerolinea thermolimosa]GAP08746.1 GTP-binding protein Era [Anaerolinea thermolimosa]HCE16458.1 GTPase Era [Anaerolinea thermolimosa]